MEHIRYFADPQAKKAAREYAGPGRIAGLAILDEPAEVSIVQVRSTMSSSAEAVISFCLQRQNFISIMPDPMQVVWASTETGELSGTYHFRWWLKRVVPVVWVAFIDSYTPGREFSDQQVRGFFRYFHHTHTAVDIDGGSEYTDTLRFVGPWGRRLDEKILVPQMRATFEQRHRRMQRMLTVMTP